MYDGFACDNEKDFQQIVTDLGVCYTFNSGRNGRETKTFSEAGNAIQINY